MRKSIHYSEKIIKCLKSQNLSSIISDISQVYAKHIMTILITMFCLGYRSKTVDMARHSDNHRTAIAHFLNKGKWDEKPLEQALKAAVIKIIYEESRKTGLPVFVIVDDTICSKTIPDSKAEHPIESAGYHYSHLKRKTDYGHQAVGIMLSCNGITLNYAIVMYDKEQSKIDIVKNIAEELPRVTVVSYLLCDSWYTCAKVSEAFIRKGFYTVGGLKTNRIIFPKGVRVGLSKFAQNLSVNNDLFHIVTVKGRKYHIYRYEGNLKDIDNAVVLISYPVGALGNPKALRAFLCTNSELSDTEILNLYVTRWEIEVFFRDVKTKLAFDQYQIRSSRGIRRLWLLCSLAYYIACCEDTRYNFSVGYKMLSRKIFEEQLDYIYDFVAHGGTREDFLTLFAS